MSSEASDMFVDEACYRRIKTMYLLEPKSLEPFRACLENLCVQSLRHLGLQNFKYLESLELISSESLALSL